MIFKNIVSNKNNSYQYFNGVNSWCAMEVKFISKTNIYYISISYLFLIMIYTIIFQIYL